MSLLSLRRERRRTHAAQASQLTSVPGKVMKQIILESVSRHMKDKKVIRSSQHALSKGKSCLTNLRTFYNEKTGMANEGRAVNVVYLDFSNAFNTVSPKILRENLRRSREG